VKERKVLIEHKSSKDSAEDNTMKKLSDKLNQETLVIDPQLDAVIKAIVSSDNLKYLKRLRNDLKELIDKNVDNKQTNDINAKLYDVLKPNIFSDIYDNILVKYFNSFYKTISKEKAFTDQIESILQHIYKQKNHINTDSLIDLESSLYLQQTFYTRMTMPVDSMESVTIDTSPTALKKINSSMNIVHIYSANNLSK
jgi:hypothetical protein